MADPLYDPSIEPRVREALTFLRPSVSKRNFDFLVSKAVRLIGSSRDYETTVRIIRDSYTQLAPYFGTSEELLDDAATAVIAEFSDGFPPPTPAELERRRHVEQEHARLRLERRAASIRNRASEERRRANSWAERRRAARRASPPRGVGADIANEALGDLGGRSTNASGDGYYTNDIVPAVQRSYGQQYHLSDDDMYDQDDEDTPHEYVIVRVRSPSRYRY